MTKLIVRTWMAAAATAAVALALIAGGVAAPPERAHAQTACASQMDLMLVLDGSESISWSQFDVLQAFASDLVASLAVGPDEVRVGIVQFAGEGEGRVEIALSGDAGAIQAGIFAMPQIIGVTDIQEGLALGQGQLSANGRVGVPHVMVLLTDGEHNEPGDVVAEAALAKNLGTEIFAIGVGDGPKLDQLNAIVSEPDVEHVFSVSDFDGLVAILQPLVEVVCPPTPTATPPPDDSPTPEPTPTAPTSSTGDPPDGEDEDVLGVSQLPEVGGGASSGLRVPAAVVVGALTASLAIASVWALATTGRRR